jgi:hypothetical protein
MCQNIFRHTTAASIRHLAHSLVLILYCIFFLFLFCFVSVFDIVFHLYSATIPAYCKCSYFIVVSSNRVLLLEAGPRDNFMGSTYLKWKIHMPAALMYNLCDDKYNW